jgi:formylglycine-generating enzyme required for sulfatase activity/energy-coupling factor transporter ATP-binding protein EcfA2
MPEQLTNIRVFVSTPGDASEERQVVLDVLERFLYRPTYREKVGFRPVVWDKPGAGTPMLASMSPQEAIDAGLPKPSECDLVVVILWSRMGTPFHYNGVDYLSGTHYELLDALRNPQTFTLIYHRTEKKQFDVDDDEGIAQYKKVQDFFKSEQFYDLANGQIRPGVNQYAVPSEFKTQFEADLEVMVKRLLERSPERPVAPNSTPDEPVIAAKKWEGSPFPGLVAFTTADKRIFFGREAETYALVRRIKESRFVAVVGASGSGKSSLVGAGLLPRLAANAISDATTGSKDWLLPDYEKGKGWSGLRFTPGELGDNPFLALAAKLAPLVNDTPISVAQKLAQSPQEAINLLLRALAGKPEWAEALLFIDQFEELFAPAQEKTREPFVRMLSVLAEQPRLRVVATIRHDFVHRVVENPMLAALLNRGTFYLSAPTPAALFEMIERPAEIAALEFERGLFAQILHDMGSEAGALVEVAYLLYELYNLTVTRSDKGLTFDGYKYLGGVEGAIGKRAEQIFQELPGEEAAKVRLLGQVFRELVEVYERGTATRQRAGHACFGAEQLALVEAFTKARLLVMDKAQVEVAHEALFRRWVRLEAWIAEYQDDLILKRQVKSAAAKWAGQGKPDSWLWLHERLERVYAMQKRLEWTPDETELAFIEPEQTRLLREKDKLTTTHDRRDEIGRRLGVIGDTRSGLGVREDATPAIVWLPVAPGGEVKIEDNKESFKVEPFYIAQYQVTYAQYEAFVQAKDGYQNPVWWQGFPKYYQPQELSNQSTRLANYPRDNISWYQSVAFARWLNSRLRGLELAQPGGGGTPLVVGKNAEIRLPTEWEWQCAAQGGKEERDYPWGAWQEGYANTEEAGLNWATAVGMYPQGAAICGAMDMSGNLFEWCLNKFGNPKETAVDESGDNRVLRGGSFYFLRAFASCAYRYYYFPFNDHGSFGFRLVVCLADSEL